MSLRACTALLLCLSACASVPVSPSTARASSFAPAPASHGRIRFVSAGTDSRPSPIGKADLEQARALLHQARNDLEPRQWEALAGKLTSAQRALERFSQVTRASGQTVQVVRGAEGLWAQGLSRAGSLLVFLVLLYPASTAGPEIDRRPESVDAQMEYEARLREVAEASRRLLEARARLDAGEAVPDLDSSLSAVVTAPPLGGRRQIQRRGGPTPALKSTTGSPATRSRPARTVGSTSLRRQRSCS